MQSNANQPVYFDDLKVSHTHSPVVQKEGRTLRNLPEEDFSKEPGGGEVPFGLSFNSYSRAAITKQNFKFNAGSELEEMTDWYSTPFRKYDPSLGRFHGVDALAELNITVGPSSFAHNNPISFNDPTGLDDNDGDEENGGGGGGIEPIPPATPLFGYDMRGYDAVAKAERGHGGNNGWALSRTTGSLYTNAFGNYTPGAGYFIVRNMARKAWKNTTCTDCFSITPVVNGYAQETNMSDDVSVSFGEEGEFARDMGQMQSGDYYQITSDGQFVVPWTDIPLLSYFEAQVSQTETQLATFGDGGIEDFRNVLTGIALITEGRAIRELRRLPKNPPHGLRHLNKLRGSYLKTLAKRAGLAGTVFSAWEATEKGWTTGATVSFAADIAVVGLSVICPVCGIVYGIGRLAVDLYGYDVADEIDANFGSDTLWNNVGSEWQNITGGN